MKFALILCIVAAICLAFSSCFAIRGELGYTTQTGQRVSIGSDGKSIVIGGHFSDGKTVR